MRTIIKRDPIKGRGVYALQLITKGELIETCELIILDLEHVQDDLEGYVYQYSKRKAAVALGSGSLYNHSDSSNCIFYFNYRKKQLLFKACKDIEPGQEITINYGYDRQSKKKFNII
ncbi:MAG: SET domain-containing protein-lysine N-methyltransferase [Bacteriovoracia bacterium]